jgi:hypothetical protein
MPGPPLHIRPLQQGPHFFSGAGAWSKPCEGGLLPGLTILASLFYYKARDNLYFLPPGARLDKAIHLGRLT